jgi:hypothetical protein
MSWCGLLLDYRLGDEGTGVKGALRGWFECGWIGWTFGSIFGGSTWGGSIGVLCMIDSVMLIYTCIWYRKEEGKNTILLILSCWSRLDDLNKLDPLFPSTRMIC